MADRAKLNNVDILRKKKPTQAHAEKKKKKHRNKMLNTFSKNRFNNAWNCKN